MSEAPENKTDIADPPEADDGFHQPSEETKRRNLITAGIILAFIFAWVVLGLRNALL